jgi:hypothetical protein
MKRSLLLAVAAPLLSLLSAPAFAACDYAATVLENHVKHDGTSLYRCDSSNAWVAVTGLPAAASGSTGYVQFNSSGALGSDSNFYWDNTNKRLGIGTTSPGFSLNVVATNPTIMVQSSVSTALPKFWAANDLNYTVRMHIAGSGAANGSFLTAQNAGYVESTGTGGLILASSNSSAPMIFATGGVQFSNERMRIDSSGNVGIGTTSPDRLLHAEDDSAATNTVTYLERLTSTSAGTPAAGIGAGLEFEVETAAANNEVGATIEAATTDVTAASEDFDLVFKTMRAGAAASEQFRVRSTGKVKVGGGSTPSVGTCGTTPAITGNDTRGVVTFGTGSPTACTITFSAAFGTAPYCTITAYGGDAGKRYWITSTSTTTMVIGIEAAATASQKFHYVCVE